MNNQKIGPNDKSATGLIIGAFIVFSIVASTAAASGTLSIFSKKNSLPAKIISSDKQANQIPVVSSTTNTVRQNEGTVFAIQSNSLEKANLKSVNDSANSTAPKNAAPESATTTVAAKPPVDDSTVYTTQSLALHNKAGDCYVVYQGKVYDVSGQAVWSTCNYGGVAGGADVTSNFANASNYFASFPQVGIYQNTTVTTVADKTTNTNANINTTVNTNTSNTRTNYGDDDGYYTSGTSTGTQTTTGRRHRNNTGYQGDD